MSSAWSLASPFSPMPNTVTIGLMNGPIALANHGEVHTAIWMVAIAEAFAKH